MGFLNKLFSDTAGMCGKNLRWEFTGDTLTINGTGEMENYDCGVRSRKAPAPWFNLDLNRAIKKIIVNDGVTTIGSSAFYNCTEVTDVKLPNSVTKIGDGAFVYCWNLKEIQLSNSILTIGNNAFAGCYSLMYIIIPTSVVEIGKWAFNACESLRSVTIPTNVTKIGESVFAACVSLKEIHYPMGCCLEKNLWTGYGAKIFPYTVAPPVKQPSPAENLRWKVDGKILTVGGVREIKCYPYNDIPWIDKLNKIQKIVIEDGVDKIAANAFIDCTRLEQVIFPASVKNVGDLAFTICFCGDKKFNGGRNVFWSLDDRILTLKKNPVAISNADFSTDSIMWRDIEHNITGFKIKDGVVPKEKFSMWLAQRTAGKEFSLG